MLCVFRESGKINGKRRVKCMVCGFSYASDTPLHQIHANCMGNPDNIALVGNELKSLLASYGFGIDSSCRCEETIHLMNTWGVVGCIEHRAEIIERLHLAAKERSWPIRILAHLLSGLLLDEAISRFSFKEKSLPPRK